MAMIGGSGLENLFKNAKRLSSETPYGTASLYYSKMEIKNVIFLPRHGPEHSIPPRRINHRANV
jgi:5'-methylthioadenosine phosphorylase